MDSIDAITYSDAVIQKAFALREILDLYKARLQGRSCAHFLEAIRLLVDAIEDAHQDWVAFCAAAFATDPDLREDEIRSQAKIELRMLRNVHRKLLPLLEAASDQGSYLIVPTIQKFMKAVAGGELFEVNLISQFEYTYGFTVFNEFPRYQLEQLTHLDAPKREAVLQQVSKFPKYIVFFSFPYVEMPSALNLTVLVHEIAHFADHVQGIYSKLLPLQLHKGSFDKLVEYVANQEKARNRDDIEAEWFQSCTLRVESWLQEIIADLLAVHILGPAYVFAFSEFLAHAAVNNSPDPDHPAPAKRLELLFDELDYLDYFKAATSISGALLAARARCQKEASVTTYSGDALGNL